MLKCERIKLIEALLIAKLRPVLNKQVQAFSLSLFPSGITLLNWQVYNCMR